MPACASCADKWKPGRSRILLVHSRFPVITAGMAVPCRESCGRIHAGNPDCSDLLPRSVPGWQAAAPAPWPALWFRMPAKQAGTMVLSPRQPLPSPCPVSLSGERKAGGHCMIESPDVKRKRLRSSSSPWQFATRTTPACSIAAKTPAMYQAMAI